MDRRISYLRSYMNKTEELLKNLPQTCKTHSRVLDIVTQKVHSARKQVECELKQLCSGSSAQNMEVDDEHTRSEIKQVLTPMTTKGKRCRDEDNVDKPSSSATTSMAEDVNLMLMRLCIAEGKSVLDCISDGMGGAKILKAFESMAIVIGKRLSLVTAEILYLMSYGEQLRELGKIFERKIQAEGTKDCNLVQRRLSDVLTSVNKHILKHTVEDVIPELHDELFKDAFKDFIERCRVAISNTESLLCLKTLPPSPVLAGEMLASVVDELRAMDDQIYDIEVGMMEWKPVFSAYSGVAKLEMEMFASKTEDEVEALWDDLKERRPKRSRL